MMWMMPMPTLSMNCKTISEANGVLSLSNGGGSVTLTDADATNELQTLSVSATGDTLYLQNGGFVIIPGISAANASGGGGGTYPTGSVFCNRVLQLP